MSVCHEETQKPACWPSFLVAIRPENGELRADIWNGPIPGNESWKHMEPVGSDHALASHIFLGSFA